MTTIYFVRHGEAVGNIKFTFQGVADNPLTEQGIKQCRLLALRLRDTHLDCIYCSPLCRAWDTGKFINEFHHVTLVPDPAFIEVCGGAMEDTDMLDLHDNFPEYMDAWDNRPWEFVGPLMEDGNAAAFARIERGIRRIVRSHPDQTVLIAAHGGVMRMFNCIAAGLDITHLNEMGWGDNTCLSCAEFGLEGDRLVSKAVMRNDTSHVDPSMVTPDFWLIKDRLRAERDARRRAAGEAKA